MTIQPCPVCGAEPKVTTMGFCTIECVNAACPELPSVMRFLMSECVNDWNSGAWFNGNKGGE